MKNKLGTEPYKGTRDFYPEEMAIQQYIFDTWSYVAELFGYERYDASVLEPSELYRSKGAENEEMVNEQTYTFTDRGDREVTLRPEMTPTVARMVAGKRRELSFPVRWYSIPNLFRYERMQRGRLREHWQFNCDVFGSTDYTVDVEVIALAHSVLTAFGATEDMFEIRLNDRREMSTLYTAIGITDETLQQQITHLNDRKAKMQKNEYVAALSEILEGDKTRTDAVIALVESEDDGSNKVIQGLRALGITNVRIDRSIARGFNYYTGTVFEIFDTAPENNRSLLGGGRYDNLTELFGGDPIPGIGFGMGDVTMRDFLETHNLLTADVSAPTVVLIPTDAACNLEAQKIAQTLRQAEISATVDVSTKKIGKKISAAGDSFSTYVIVVGEEEIQTERYTLKNLIDQSEHKGSIAEIIEKLT